MKTDPVKSGKSFRWASPQASVPSPSFSDESEEPVVDDVSELLEGNRKWVQKNGALFFEMTCKSQSPRYLWIGCSDSRVPAEEITGMEFGELFVHRNIANMVVGTDANLLSVLEYAVNVLKVPHIIVCGHYGCGGVRAAFEKLDSGVLGNWLCNIRDVHRMHHDELTAMGDEQEEQLRRLVELNVREQCINLLKTATVQKSLLEHRRPRIHGMVYDLRDGVLKELPIDFHTISDTLGDVYALYT
uniref:Carbonic anhydrase n=1 Tax=Spongospora subterranea TaxID=70186 RepID=A0A0H5QZR2_9EUKA|eukprot:CRZ01064.1 hypothetical protein [Spongospora subterranea]